MSARPPLDRYLSRRRRRHPRRAGGGDLAGRPRSRDRCAEQRAAGRRDAVAVASSRCTRRHGPVRGERADGRHDQRVRRRRRLARAPGDGPVGRRGPVPPAPRRRRPRAARRQLQPRHARASCRSTRTAGSRAGSGQVLGHVGSGPDEERQESPARALRRARARRLRSCSWSTWAPTRSGATAATTAGLVDDGDRRRRSRRARVRATSRSAPTAGSRTSSASSTSRSACWPGTRPGTGRWCRRCPRRRPRRRAPLPSHILLDGDRLLVGTRTADVLARFARSGRRPARAVADDALPGALAAALRGRRRVDGRRRAGVERPRGAGRGRLGPRLVAAAVACLCPACAVVTVL